MNADDGAETEMNSDVQVTPCRGDRGATSLLQSDFIPAEQSPQTMAIRLAQE